MKVSNVGITVGSNCSALSNGAMKCLNLTSNTTTASNVTGRLVFGNTVQAYTMTSNNVTCNVMTSNVVTCGNAMCRVGMSLPKATSFTGSYAELANIPLTTCYTDDGLSFNTKTFASTALTSGTTGKATFYASSDGTSNGTPIFSNIASLQLSCLFPAAKTYSAVISCITSVSTDNITIIGYGTTNGSAVPAATRFYLLAHGV